VGVPQLTLAKIRGYARYWAENFISGEISNQFSEGNLARIGAYIGQDLGYDLADFLGTTPQDSHLARVIVDGTEYTGYKRGEVFDAIRTFRSAMRSLGYVSLDYREREVLSSKCIELLDEKPLANINIFISYRRAESSLLALYLQARFRNVGGEAFVDVNSLKLGDPWHSALEEKVKSSANFVCLIGPSTLESAYVRQEIEWAIEANVTIIPVMHDGFNAEDSLNKMLVEKHPFLEKITQKHGHVITENDNPNAYRNAADEILTSLGYAVL